MASKTSQLPIYRSSYNLLTHLTRCISKFPRNWRPTVGEAMHQHGVRLIMQIYRANAAQDKTEHIAELLEALEVLELQLQLAHDLRLISTRELAAASDLTECIGRQAGGWKKSTAIRQRAPQYGGRSHK